ncbi:hypothetical protein [Peribacillus muralis]
MSRIHCQSPNTPIAGRSEFVQHDISYYESIINASGAKMKLRQVLTELLFVHVSTMA